jgi:hypothetical protein
LRRLEERPAFPARNRRIIRISGLEIVFAQQAAENWPQEIKLRCSSLTRPR